MVDIEETETEVFETENDDVEDVASGWTSSKHPRYEIAGHGLDGYYTMSYDGRIFINTDNGWTPTNRWVVSLVVASTAIPWDEAREHLEAGSEYWGHIKVSRSGVETRTAWLASAPLTIKKISNE